MNLASALELGPNLGPALNAPIPVAMLSTGPLVIATATAFAIGLYLLIKVAGLVLGVAGKGVEAIGRFLMRVPTLVMKEVRTGMDLVGSVLVCITLLPLVSLNWLFKRRRPLRRKARALRAEASNALGSIYYLLVGNLAWFFGLSRVTAALERSIPSLAKHSSRLHATPGELYQALLTLDPRGAGPQGLPQFPGYRVTRELKPGGSGARVYLAEPDSQTRNSYRPGDGGQPQQVVLKSFDLAAGSTVPQIVRESRSLAAARSLGLVLDHHLGESTFWYAMPFAPGESLDVVTRRMHDRAGEEGLPAADLELVLTYASDLLKSLQRFHGAGLWHKDIKPGNLIVNGTRAQLVDLGLVTPLASAMTLTTHGTEYFRDPELVRMAIRGARVRDVEGIKFDLYSTGAVLYSMLEGSFPAHGSLSRLTKPCPDGLAFIVRRAMADLSQRYSTSEEILGDLNHLASAQDLWKVRPADLPSLSGGPSASAPLVHPEGGYSRTPEHEAAASAGHTAFLGVSSQWGTRPADGPPDHQHLSPKTRRKGRVIWMKYLAVGALIPAVFAGMMELVSDPEHAQARRTLEPVPHDQGDGESVMRYTTADETGVDPGADVALRPMEGEHTTGKENGKGASTHLLQPQILEGLHRGSRILILASPGVDTSHSRIQDLRQGLGELGHILVGEGNDAQSIELAAKATATLASAEAFDQRARARLMHCIEDQDGLDAVVWMGLNTREKIVLTLVTASSPRR